MQLTKAKIQNNVIIPSFIVGTIGLVTTLAFDKYYWQTGILTEGWPNFTSEYIIRSTVILLSVLAIFYSLSNKSKQKPILNQQAWTFERWSVIGITAASTAFLIIFLFNTGIFNSWSQEDSIAEWGSFLFLILSSLLFLFSFVMVRTNKQVSTFSKWLFLLFAFTFFSIGMEEVSWFQRVFEIKTPEILKNSNLQGEINLHNLATSKVEVAYYFSSFLFLVLLPYINIIYPNLLKNNRFAILVPRPFIALAGAFACAYNFDMWNIIFIQLSFWGTITTLSYYFCMNTVRNDKIIVFSVLVVIILTQVSFLANGNNFQRLWEVTEYKELLIPMAFFIYSIDIFRTTLKLKDFQLVHKDSVSL